MTIIGNETILAGWGANFRATCFLIEPTFTSEVGSRLDRCGTIARGLGRSYGDCAINAGGQVISTVRMNRLLSFDEDTGTLTCEGGTSLESFLSRIVAVRMTPSRPIPPKPSRVHVEPDQHKSC
jgi:FAD binding domain